MGHHHAPLTNEAMNTHTQYHHHVRALQLAREALAQTDKYLKPDSPHYLPDYIAKLESMQRQAQSSGEDLSAKIQAMKNNLVAYQKRAAEAQAVLDSLPAKLDALSQANEVFLAPPERQQECLYVLDAETCQASCMGWESDEPMGETTVLFTGKPDIELTHEHQTDAVRVWHHHVMVSNLCISDHRCYGDAHRDAVQLIPPAQYREVDGIARRVGDQLAGTVMTDVCIRACTIVAPNGPLQGIFASDGMQRNLRIIDNDITTMGSHTISIAGLLTGGVIAGNVLRQVPGSDIPKIRLYPARIGGNMADDGVVTVLSFAYEPGEVLMQYGDLETGQAGNRLVMEDGTETELTIDDLRGEIPAEIAHMALGVHDFNYHAYLKDFSTLTYAQYCEKDPYGWLQLQAWLRLRHKEFSEGRRQGHVLGQPSAEQKHIAENNLGPALDVLRQGSLQDVVLSEIEQTAIRSFIMKRLAIMHSRVEPLQDLGAKNEKRDAILRFLLPAELRVIA